MDPQFPHRSYTGRSLRQQLPTVGNQENEPSRVLPEQEKTPFLFSLRNEVVEVFAVMSLTLWAKKYEE